MKIITFFSLIKSHKLKTLLQLKIRGFKLFLNVKKIKSILHIFLKDGLYAFESNKLCLIKDNKKRAHFILRFKKSNNKIDGLKKYLNNYSDCKIVWGEGSWSKKITVIFDDIVVSVYRNKSYIKWFNNIQKYLDKTNYPKCKYIYFDYKSQYIVCQKVHGKALNQEGGLEYAKDILKLNSSMIYEVDYMSDALAKLNAFGLKDIIFYIQHGDLAPCNILVTNSECKLIDFDTINMYPMLQDFFRLIADIPHGFDYYFCELYDVELKELFFSKDTSLTQQEKDKYLACFFILNPWMSNRINLYNIPNNYLLSKKAIESISGKKIDV